MTPDDVRSDHDGRERARPGDEQRTGGGAFAEMTSCCGTMAEMKQGCPCGSVLKRHRAAVYTTLVGIGLAFLVMQAGWILGIIAFFRTF